MFHRLELRITIFECGVWGGCANKCNYGRLCRDWKARSPTWIKLLFTCLFKPQHDHVISTGRRIHRVDAFNRLAHSSSCWFQHVASCWFQQVEAGQANVIDHTRAAAKRPPLFCPLRGHVQPQPVEINNLQCVEINNSMSAPTCWNQQLDECDGLLKSRGRVGVSITKWRVP